MSQSDINKFKSTYIAGEFRNVDLPNSDTLSFSYFQRDIQVDGNIINSNLTNELDSKADMVIVDNILNVLDTKANLSYVDSKISELVDSSPETLDTLKELANALGDDPNFASTVSNNIGLKADKTYTDAQLLLKDDVINVNNKLALKANINNATLTGTTTIHNINHTGTIYSPGLQNALNNYTLLNNFNNGMATTLKNNITNGINGILHFGLNPNIYTEFNTNNIGSISVNRMSGGNAEMNFIQNGKNSSPNLRAFSFDVANSDNTLSEIVRINKSGEIITIGNLTSPTITTINSNISNITNSISTINSNINTINNGLLLKDNITDVNNKISNLQNQIDNIELIEGPEGPQGPQGIQGIPGPIGSFDSNSDINCSNITVSGSITNTELTELINTKANISSINNVNNTSDLNKPVSTATQNALNLKANINNASLTGTTTIQNINHTGTLFSPSLQNTLNVYTLLSTYNAGMNTKANLSLVSNVNNTSDANKPISIAQQEALDLKANLSLISNIDNTSDLDKPISTLVQSALNSKADLSSISNINNTSDLNKPISTATQNALNLKANSNNASLTGTINIQNINHTGTLFSPSLQNTLNVYTLLSTYNAGMNTKANSNNASLTGTTNIQNINHTGTLFSPALQTALNVYTLLTTYNAGMATKLNNNTSGAIAGYLHFTNNSQVYTELLTQNFASISVNKMPGSNGEMNLICNGNQADMSQLRAFSFDMATPQGFVEIARINKNGDFVCGNITSPTITTMDNNLLLKDNITDVNNKLSLKADVLNPSFAGTMYVGDIVHVGTINSPAIQNLLNLKADINNPTITGTLICNNFVNNGSFHSPALQNTLNNYALLNSSPTFTGDLKAKTYAGNVLRVNGTFSFEFTASSLPSTIVVDSSNNSASYGIPDMPIGTRFTVIKTNNTTTLYSTASDVYFYRNRRYESWDTNVIINEDARTFIRVDIVSKITGNPLKVWMTESSHIHNIFTEIKRQSIGAWMLDGADFGRVASIYRPIICSTKVFGPGNSDDGFLVNPGYTLVIYSGQNYTGNAITINNTQYGFDVVPMPLHYSSSPLNDMESVKLFYNNVEIIFDGIS